MKKVAFIGLEPIEKDYFRAQLSEDEYQLLFLDTPVDIHTLDPEIEALSVFVSFNVTRDVIDLLPQLKLIACRSTGYNNVDLDAAGERGITVANTPGYGSSSVAEFAFGLILMLSRKMNIVRRETADQEIDRVAERGWDLDGKIIGIVGLGAIGRGVTKIAHGFGMKILASDPNHDADFAAQYGVEFVDNLERICREADVLTLHAPYRPENHHLISNHLLSQMKPTALVINTSRGELLNTLTLARMLQQNQLGGAGLDVIEDESFLTDPNAVLELAATGDEQAIDKLKHALAMLSLERMPNAIITNHNAFNTVEAIERINQMTVENIAGIFDGGKVYSV